MAFLTLDGWTVPVARGGGQAADVIGEEGRTFDGSRFVDRRAVKRRWSGTTVPISRLNAESLRGLLLGQGNRWGFGTAGDLYSYKGAGPTGSTTSGQWLATAPDTYPIVDHNGQPYAKFSAANSLGPRKAITNLLDSANRNPGAATSDLATVGSASKATNATRYVRGSASLLVGRTTPMSATDGAETTAVAMTAAAHHATVCLGHSGVSGTVLVRIIGSTSGTITTTTVTLSSTSWVRAFVEFTSVAENVRIQVLGGTATECYVDELQLANEQFPTPWYDGTLAAADQLAYSSGLWTACREFTVEGWIWGPTTDEPSVFGRYAFVATGPSTRNFIALFRRLGSTQANTMAFRIIAGDGTNHQINVGTFFANDWHHVACRVRRVSGVPYFSFFKDGVLQATEQAVSTTLDLSAITGFYVGNANDTTEQWNGRIGPLSLVPYAMSDAHIAALAVRTAAPGSTPAIKLGGVVHGEEVSVQGAYGGSSYMPLVLSNAFDNTAQAVGFELVEE